MGLVLWMPCTKDLHNQGLVNTNPIGICTYEAGKIGNCAKVTSTIDTGLSSDKWDYSTKSISFGGWFKFNKVEMQAAVLNKSTDTIQRYPSFNLLGKDSYNGFALSLYTNYIYNPTADLTSLNIQAHMCSSTSSWACGFGTIEWDTWIHLFITWDFDSKTFTAYKNGTKVSSYTISNWDGNFTYRGAFNIAEKAVFGGDGPAVILPFRVNDVRVYDHCLSPKEVKEISKGLVLHYPLNDAACSKNLASNTDWERTSSNEYMRILDSYQDAGTGEYTFSCEMKVAAGTPNVFIYSTDRNYTSKYIYSVSNIYTNGVLDGKLSQQWQKVVCKLTFTVSAEDSTIMPHINTYYTYGSGAIVSVRNPKLEKGWNPNPIYTNSLYNIVYDCSGYQNNGTITGALSYSTDSPRYKTCTQTSSSGKIQKDAFLPSAIIHYTISVWCKITDPNAAANLWTKHSNESKGIIQGPDGGWIYSYNGGGLITRTSFLTTSGTITQTYPSFGQNYKDGNWHMYTIVGNGNINTCYLDGVMTGRSTISDFVSYNINGQLNIGFTEECLVSDYRCYVTALSAEDIKELYNTSAYVLDNGTLLTYSVEE